MQLQAYDGYIDNGLFYPKEKPINLSGRFRAVLTILDIMPPLDNPPDWATELLQMIKNDTSEKLNIEDFPRMVFGREPILFDDTSEPS